MNTYLSRKISILSFVSAILVVFVHAYNLYDEKAGYVHYRGEATFYIEELISQGIARIAVPFFFLFSGYLFFLNFPGSMPAFVPKIKKRLRTVAIPYLLWSLLSLFMLMGLDRLMPTARHEFSALNITDKLFVHPVAYQMWFLRDLIILSVLSPVLFLIVRYTGWLVFFVFLVLWLCGIDYGFVSAQALCFFSLGACLSLTRSLPMLQTFRHPGWSVLMWLWIAVLLVKLYLFRDLTEADHLADVIHKLAIMLGLAAVWTAYDVWMNQRFPVWNIRQALSSGFSFFLFAFHEPTLSTVKKILYYVMPATAGSSLLQYFIAPVLTMLLAAGCSVVLQRWIPQVYRLLTGGR